MEKSSLYRTYKFFRYNLLRRLPGDWGRYYQRKFQGLDAKAEFEEALRRSNGKICIDLGANVGLYTKKMASAAKRVIAFEIFAGTDWRDLNEEDWALVDRESRDREGRRPLSDGMIACHLSHRKALEGVATGEDELAAVFEDDVTLAPEIGGVLDALKRLYASGWKYDIVFLHRQSMDKTYVPLKKVDDGIRLGITKYSDWGAQGYVISKNGAGRLLKRFPKIVNRNDHTLHAYWESGLNVFSLETPVVFDGNEAGNHSFLQEAADSRPSRNLCKLPYRAFSNLREEVLKRVYYFRKVRKAKNAGDSA